MGPEGQKFLIYTSLIERFFNGVRRRKFVKEIIAKHRHIPPEGINYWRDETDLVEPADGREQKKNSLVKEIPIFIPPSNSYTEED